MTKRVAINMGGFVVEEFNEKLSTVVDERGADYGHPSDDFGRADKLISVINECRDPEMRHALRMVAVKIARLIHSPEHLDSIVDIAGYAKTMALILDRRRNGSGNEKSETR